MTHELIFGKKFEDEFSKLDNSIRQDAWKKIQRLKESLEIGKHLKYLNLWELHVGVYRIFYVVDNYRKKLSLLSVKHKDECEKYVRGLSFEDINRLLN
jgi:mRNA-degrading endonuclease RelE of RelBE toxin-antitoxin system